MKRSSLKDQQESLAGVTDDRCSMAYAPTVLAAFLRAATREDPSTGEMLYQRCLDNKVVALRLDQLLMALGPVLRPDTDILDAHYLDHLDGSVEMATAADLTRSDYDDGRLQVSPVFETKAKEWPLWPADEPMEDFEA